MPWHAAAMKRRQRNDIWISPIATVFWQKSADGILTTRRRMGRSRRNQTEHLPNATPADTVRGRPVRDEAVAPSTYALCVKA